MQLLPEFAVAALLAFTMLYIVAWAMYYQGNKPTPPAKPKKEVAIPIVSAVRTTTSIWGRVDTSVEGRTKERVDKEKAKFTKVLSTEDKADFLFPIIEKGMMVLVAKETFNGGGEADIIAAAGNYETALLAMLGHILRYPETIHVYKVALRRMVDATHTAMLVYNDYRSNIIFDGDYLSSKEDETIKNLATVLNTVASRINALRTDAYSEVQHKIDVEIKVLSQATRL